MRWLIAAIVCGVVGIAAFVGLIVGASESGEVVQVRTRGDGGAHVSRLWVVDHGGSMWLRSGSAEKRWFRHIEQNPECEVERGGRLARYRAVPVRDAAVASEVNAAFKKKYGAADWIVALSGNAANRIVVRLEPLGGT